jgi:hypothetical protein
MGDRGKWPFVKSKPVTLSVNGRVAWGQKEVGIWWKDDFAGYRFTSDERSHAPIWAETQRELRSAISASCNTFFGKENHDVSQ